MPSIVTGQGLITGVPRLGQLGADAPLSPKPRHDSSLPFPFNPAACLW